MNNWDTFQLKRVLFDLFDNAREIFNNYYRLDRNFTEEDLIIIKKYIKLIENNIEEIKEEI